MRGDLQGVRTLIREISDDSFIGTAVSLSMKESCAGGHLKQTAALAEESKPDKRLWAYVELAAGHARAGDVRSAEEYAGRIAVAGAPGTAHDGMAIGYAHAGLLERANALIPSIEDNESKALACSAVALAYAMRGRIDEASRLLNQAVDATRKVQGADARFETYEKVIPTHIRAGMATQARKLAHEAAALARSTDRGDMYLEPAICLMIRAGDIAGARKEMTNLHEHHSRASVYAEIGQFQARAMSRDAFQKWAGGIDDPLERAMAYVGAARALTPEE